MDVGNLEKIHVTERIRLNSTQWNRLKAAIGGPFVMQDWRETLLEYPDMLFYFYTQMAEGARDNIRNRFWENYGNGQHERALAHVERALRYGR